MEPIPLPSGCRSLTGSVVVLLNIQDFYGLVEGQTCYSSMLDTSFVFHPDAQDSAQANPGTFAGWNSVVEAQVNSKIAGEQDTVSVLFEQEYASPIIQQDVEIRFHPYLVRTKSTAFPDTLRFTGLADITFRRGDDGSWRITDWVDHRGSVSDSTWGRLRGDNRTP